jgi:acylphosphatase
LPCGAIPASAEWGSMPAQNGYYMTRLGISMFPPGDGRKDALATVSGPQGSDLCYNRAAAGISAASRAAVQTLAKRFYVSGFVQGVGFRFFAERAATKLGVSGYVKNLSDGRVEVYAIGNAAQHEALRNELRRGPRMASVEQVVEADAEILREYSSGFSIEREY